MRPSGSGSTWSGSLPGAPDVPTYRGSSIFGEKVRMTPGPLPRRVQVDQYWGVDGYEWKDGGAAGFRMEVRGELTGAGQAGLRAAQGVFTRPAPSGIADGQEGVLVDTTGESWPFMRLSEFRLEGEMLRDSDGTCVQGYIAIFDSWI